MQRIPSFIFTFVFLLLLLASQNLAAQLNGSIYGPGLEPLKNCVLTVNTTPIQRFVLNMSVYTLSLEPGTYNLKVECFEDGEFLTDVENVTIPSANSSISPIYHFDFIAIPDLEGANVDVLANLTFVPSENETGKSTSNTTRSGKKTEANTLWFFYILLLALFVFGLLVLVYFYRSHQKGKMVEEDQKGQDENKFGPSHMDNELSDDLKQIIAALRDEDGRATQKELRQLFHWSEAKMSLALAELESYGIVKRIKKGRGNIVVLVKDPLSKGQKPKEDEGNTATSETSKSERGNNSK